VKLIRKLHVKAQHFTKTNQREIARWKFPGQAKKTDFEGNIEIQLPDKIYPSAEGHLVKCSYILDIELDLPWAFDSNIRPHIIIALLPAPGQGMWFIQDMGQLGGWKAW